MMVDQDYYDEVFATNVANPVKLRQNEYRNRLVAQYVVGNVLDLGCGLGLIADMIKGEYVGVDFSPFAIEYAREHTANPQAHFLRANLYTPPCIGGHFDTVILSEVLEHLEDPGPIVALAFRHASKRIVVTVPVEMAGPAHVKVSWSRGDLENLFGDLAVCEVFSNEDPRMAPTLFAVKELDVKSVS